MSGSTTATGYPGAVTVDSPASYWRLDEPAGAAVAAPTAGTISGAYGGGANEPSLGVAGALAGDPNSAASFDGDLGGAGDYVDFGDNYAFDGTKPFSLEAWINPTVADTTERRVFAKTLATTGYGYRLNVQASGAWVDRLSSTGRDIASTSPLPLNAWSYVVATYDGATLRIYLNGTLAAATASTRSLPALSGTPFRIGNSSTSLSRAFAGRVDEPAVYTYALTDAQVRGHYDAGTAQDSTAPAIVLTAPANGSSTSNATPTFAGTAGTAGGDSSTVTVQVYAGTTAAGTPQQTLNTSRSMTDGAYSVSATTALAPGTYTARSEQTDTAGNRGLSSANTFTITSPAPDTTAPVITLSAPANGSSTSNTTPTFAGTAGTASGDSSTVTVKVFAGTSAAGTPQQTLTTSRSTTDGAYSVSATTGLAPGNYTAEAEQTDNAGNRGLSNANTFTIAAEPPATGYRSTVLADGPSAYWRLGEPKGATTAVSDVGNNAAYGTGPNAPQLGAAGALVGDLNTSASFDGATKSGTGDYVDAGATFNFANTAAFSLEAWVYPTLVDSTERRVFAKTLANGNGYRLNVTSSGTWVDRMNAAGRDQASGPPLSLNTWSYIVATYDGSTLRLYINGSLVRSVASARSLPAVDAPFRIGQSSTSLTRTFGGRIDEAAVYDHALSAQQIANHFHAATTTPSDPTIAAAGDIACDPANPAFNGGLGTATQCRQQYTSDLLANGNLTAVLPLGDEQYDDATLAKFQQVYAPTWGRVRTISRPVPGNHEYLTPNAADYFAYFGSAAGDPATGYYSYDVGAWHLVALNSEVGLGAGGTQDQWLKADLAAHPARCTLAYWHRPRFTSGAVGNDPTYDFFWQTLSTAGVDVVLNGHSHVYERFAPQTPAGVADPAGIREFTVGTGGEHLSALGVVQPNSEALNNTTYGVLVLTLHPTSYDWKYVPEAGGTFSDSGTASCH